MQWQSPQWANIIGVAGVTLGLYLLGKILVPRHPKAVRFLLGMILSAVVLSVLQNCFPKVPLSLNGWTVTVVSFLGLPGVLLLLVTRLLLG